MTLATRRGIAALILLTFCPVNADAWWFGGDGARKGKSALQKGAAKNAQWPSPYLCPDRAQVRSPFETMVQNGWRRQNLLGAHHFDKDATQLTQSGKLKVQWIMTQSPPQFRQVFIERSLEEGVTESRIATAQEFAQRVAMGDETPRVADTHLVSEGRPAATVDFVNTNFRDNMPTPALPEPSADSSN